MRILVTDGTTRAALATARSLVRAGHDVHVAAPGLWSLAGVSRGVRSHVVREDALSAPAAFAQAIADLVARLGIELLLPVTDGSVEALLAHRRLLPRGVALPLPAYSTYQLATDKAAAGALAEASGFSLPEVAVVHRPDDARWRAAEGLFPAAIRPTRPLVPVNGNGRRTKVGVAFADNATECAAVLARLPTDAFPVMVQRRVFGPGEGVFAVRWAGRVVCAFAHRRLREKPPSGGVSVYRESIPLETQVLRAAEKLLDRLDWTGAAMIECKRDRETGALAFVEINGRFWGSLQLAIDAGADFPELLVACVRGSAPRELPSYRVGVRSRWFWGDVDALMTRLRRSARVLHLDGREGRWAAVWDFLRWRPGRDREEIFRWRDPAPFLLETLDRLLPG